MSTTLSSILVLCLLAVTTAFATPDTLRRDNGTFGSTATPREGWEESIIFAPNTPCSIVGVMIYFGAGTGEDEIRITGDAAEGTIPPTQYCFPYNTLGIATTTVTGKGWKTIMFTGQDIRIDGNERVVVQHIMSASGPLWGQDNNGQSPTTSYLYDPVTPNPNFYGIPGIYSLAKGDFMVRLIIDDKPAYRKPPTWVDVTAEAGLLSGSSPIKTDQVSVVDWDHDGYDDICVGGQFFHNTGKGTFVKVTLPIQAGAPTAWADVDNDGDMDCFVAGGFGGEKLWRNDENGVFVDVTAGSGLSNNAPLVTALWLDIEHDGDLDLFLANGRSESNGNEVYFQDKLWRNDGDWRFTDVTKSSKLAEGEPAPFYDTWGASLTDYNNDGYTDIFVATYRLAPDRLYKNNGDGTFTEVSTETGTRGIPTTDSQYFGHGMGSEWADVDNDGDVDLLVGNLGHPDSRAQYSNPSLMLMNGGSAKKWLFANEYAMQDGALVWHGIAFKEMNAGMCVADFNHDGISDVWHGQISYEAYGSGANRPAHFYLGQQMSPPAKRRFVDNTWQTGMFIHGAWTACRIDFDRDGDMDLICASGTEQLKLYRNDLPKSGSSITFRLLDKRVGANKSGYGSRVNVYAGGMMHTRWLPGTISGGRMSQMSHDLHVGFTASSIDSVVVTWPDGRITRHTGCLPQTFIQLSSDGKSTPIIGLQPQQISPSHGSIVTPAPNIEWRADASAKVDVEVILEGATKATVVSQENVAGNRLPTTLASGSTYSWRIRSHGAAVWSPYWTFSVGMPKPLAVAITSPADKAQGVPVTTTATWSASGYEMKGLQMPVAYNLSVYALDANNKRTPVFDTVTSSTSAALSSLPPSQRLECVVTPTNVAFTGSTVRGDSSAITFTTYDVPQAPSLISPANNATAVVTRPRFQWSRPKFVDKGFEIEVDTLPLFTTATLKRASDTTLTWTPPLKAGRIYYWHTRGNNLAGSGRWSDASTFTTEGTTDVADFREAACEATRIECYDLRGNLVGKGQVENLSQLLEPLRGVLLLVKRNELGALCGSELVVR